MKKTSLSAHFEILHRGQLNHIIGGGHNTALPFCKGKSCDLSICRPDACHCDFQLGYCVNGSIIDPRS
ncbi:hypothetical protein KTO58_14705 [Chitinophaga pendula]|uniref:hypothetical protein n=1 Tax=Chitinophaga TaxID=79328 RepID=UPI0012FE1BD0|nr:MULTISPECIES: hypothetical protein [Chitinophaga]UCJ04951.1 hypothetical protein KTO58_14705 [Chitinophaga pendula]